MISIRRLVMVDDAIMRRISAKWKLIWLRFKPNVTAHRHPEVLRRIWPVHPNGPDASDYLSITVIGLGSSTYKVGALPNRVACVMLSRTRFLSSAITTRD